MVIIFVGNALVLFAGSVLVMVGGVLSVDVFAVKLDVNWVIRLFPVRSVILFIGMVSVYVTPDCHAFGDVMVSMLFVMVLVMVCAVFVLVFTILMLLYVLPDLIGTLKVILITLFVGTFNAPFTGSIETTLTGAEPVMLTLIFML
jgi:hypothetical protein